MRTVAVMRVGWLAVAGVMAAAGVAGSTEGDTGTAGAVGDSVTCATTDACGP
jgi:hypothetical protein